MRYETIATLTNETYLITPLEDGQALHFNGNRLTGPVGEPIRVYGTGPVEISQGKWGNRLRVTGEYDGPYFDGSTPSTVPAESLTLQRSIDGSPWVTIAEGLALDGAVTDPLPSLKETNAYRAITKTSLPTSAQGEETEIVWEPPFGGTHIYLNGGPNFGTVCHASGHIAGEAPSLHSVLHHFGTSPHPVVYYGTERSDRITFTANLVDDSTPREEWLTLSVQPYIVCYRDRRGRRTFGRLTLTANDAGGVVTISGTVDATHWEEGPQA